MSDYRCAYHTDGVSDVTETLLARLAAVETRCETVLADPYPYSARGAAQWILAAIRGEE